MIDENLGDEQIDEITRFVDIEAPPPQDRPTALLLFGTNQAAPVTLAAERYHCGLAPLIIATGGVNPFYAISWEPVYSAELVTRDHWPDIPEGRRRVIREWEEVSGRLIDGSFRSVTISDGAWH